MIADTLKGHCSNLPISAANLPQEYAAQIAFVSQARSFLGEVLQS
jgi:hypothetical protein